MRASYRAIGLCCVHVSQNEACLLVFFIRRVLGSGVGSQGQGESSKLKNLRQWSPDDVAKVQIFGLTSGFEDLLSTKYAGSAQQP